MQQSKHKALAVACVAMSVLTGLTAWAGQRLTGSAINARAESRDAPYIRPDVRTYLHTLKANPGPKLTRGSWQ